MKGGKFYFFILFFLCLFIWQSFVFAQEQKSENTSEAKLTEALLTEENLIHHGDLIDVDVVGSVEYDWRGTLTPEGIINGIDYIENPVYGLCRTETEVAAEVAKALSKFLREPKVEVKIIDRSSRPFSVLYGAVKMPQRFQIKRPVRLNELLIVAGGMTDKASGEIQIFRSQDINCLSKRVKKTKANDESSTRQEKFVIASQTAGSELITIKIGDLLTGKKDANPQIFGGDIVTVLEADLIYVIGGVANPKQLYVRSQITLTRAIAGAGGLSKDAKGQKVIISRIEGGERKLIAVDYEKIKGNQSEDIILRPLDIIEVGQKGREKGKLQTRVKNGEIKEKNLSSLPLRVID
jgi:protein involved in polysaccharide export with SLBB domain